jgi:regulator of nucleoside diphosphate kinase
MTYHDIFISARDAEALAAMLGAHRRAHPFEADASDELADLLLDARFVPAERLPADRVALERPVTYVDEASGARRTVTLVLPDDAEPAKGRVSVLSPVGLALIGRKRGAAAVPVMPNGRELRLRIVETGPALELLREAA